MTFSERRAGLRSHPPKRRERRAIPADRRVVDADVVRVDDHRGAGRLQ
ncbi:hypothetical protein HH308_04190 [Gordonia sp. TBRC 11910]|uniref:Uncharacterized protein n=1 Tax=Gordonia asplenii TaxID=2725283 RepID=A0A848KW57_9ACTN|nr:hypothetical protein [Gordonia asplenii]NMO00411.1 hypothetical protein [Gordonia asplenii]